MPRFDIGQFMEQGGKFAYEILSEQKKYKNKMDEIEAKIKGEREEKEKERQSAALKGAFTASVNLLGSGNINAPTKRYIEQSYVIPLAQQLGIPYVPIVQAETTMPGGDVGVEGLYNGGYTPPEPNMQLFGAPVEEPKERTYGATKKEWEEKETFKAKLKPEPKPQLGKTPKERQLDRDIAIVKEIASFPGGEKKIKKEKPGLWPTYMSAKRRLQKRASYQRYAEDADNYFDRRLHLYGQLDEEVAKQRAKEDTIKFIRMMGIEPSALAPYLRER